MSATENAEVEALADALAVKLADIVDAWESQNRSAQRHIVVAAQTVAFSALIGTLLNELQPEKRDTIAAMIARSGVRIAGEMDAANLLLAKPH